MPVLLLLLLLAVIVAIALVAAGRGDAMGPAGTRRGPLGQLPPYPSAEDIDALRFSLGLRGYRMDEVDRVLDHLRDELIIRDLRIAELEASVASSMSDDALYEEGGADAYAEGAQADADEDADADDDADRVAVRPPEKG